MRFRLSDEFEAIANKALTTPSSTDELMQLKVFMEQVETETIFALEKRLYQAQTRLAFLVDYATFTPSEMRLNANTFTWHSRMPAVIEEHKAIIAEKRAQYEDALKVRFPITY